MSQFPLVHAVIATFNEEEVLRICLDSLESQEGVRISPIVANAGKPLSRDLAERCLEIQLDRTCFWAASMQAGFDKALELNAEIILIGNADNRFLPRSVGHLLTAFLNDPDSVFGSPGYIAEPNGTYRLQFSRDLVVPFFLHNYHRRDWDTLEDAPEGVMPTDMAGQGVMFRAAHLRRFRMQPDLLPQCRSDHALWTSMRRAGVKFFLVCKAGIVNERPLSASAKQSTMSAKAMWMYLTSPFRPDSTACQWRFRRLTQPMPVAILSFAITTPATWVYRLAQAGIGKVRRPSSPS